MVRKNKKKEKGSKPLVITLITLGVIVILAVLLYSPLQENLFGKAASDVFGTVIISLECYPVFVAPGGLVNCDVKTDKLITDVAGIEFFFETGDKNLFDLIGVDKHQLSSLFVNLNTKIGIYGENFGTTFNPGDTLFTLQLQSKSTVSDGEFDNVRFNQFVLKDTGVTDPQGNPQIFDTTTQNSNTITIFVAECGNNQIDPLGCTPGVNCVETCDDGNLITETQCDYGTDSCTSCNEDCTSVLTLSGPSCGDGTINSGDGETCDDGNTVSGDGCSSLCKAEAICEEDINGIVSLWHGENNVLDSVGNNDGGTFTGSYESNGKLGNAFSFNGVNNYVVVPYSGSLDLTGEVTVSAWIKLAGSITDGKIVGNQKGTTGNGGYKFGVYSNKVEFEIRDSNNGGELNRGVAGGTILQPNVWYHVVGVYSDSGNYLKTYVNGVLDRNGVSSRSLGSSTGNLIIGKEPFSNNYYFNGQIDEVAVYDKALSSSEIASLFAAGEGGSCDLPASSCGDGLVTGNEVCDDGNLITETSCPYGQASCSLCNSDCTAALTLTGDVCGDGTIAVGENCDGNTRSCTNAQGYVGIESCTTSCTWSNICEASGSCGNGVREGNEQCDESDFGGDTCTSIGQKQGVLQCTSDLSCSYNTNLCNLGDVDNDGNINSNDLILISKRFARVDPVLDDYNGAPLSLANFPEDWVDRGDVNFCLPLGSGIDLTDSNTIHRLDSSDLILIKQLFTRDITQFPCGS